MKTTPVRSGTRWGMLTVLRPIEKNQWGQVRWAVKCDCGGTRAVWGYSLVKNDVVSCGCMRRKNGKLVPNGRHVDQKEMNPEADPEIHALGKRFAALAQGDKDVMIRGFLHGLDVLGDRDLLISLKRKWKQFLKLKESTAAPV